jgi:hypothetical protein
MTAPTPKPDEPKREKNVPKRPSRRAPAAALAGSACVAFTLFALGLTRLLPPPHTQADYLIVGTLATLAALITIFAGMVLGRGKK